MGQSPAAGEAPGSAGAPALSSGVVVRPRVVDEITTRLDRLGVIHVHGPPGIGKTTAVAQAAERIGAPVAWLTLSDWHREPGRLLSDLADALSLVTSDARLPRPTGGGHPGLLLNASRLGRYGGFGGPIVLVLDDCHTLAGAAKACEVIGALVRDRNPDLRIAIVGREVLPLPGLGVAGHHPDAYVSRDVLDADIEETREILSSLGSTVDPAEAQAANGGWVAGLVFESWRAVVDAHDVRAPLDIYFATTVRPHLPATAFSLLVDTAAFTTVSADRAAAVGHDDAAAVLRLLRERGFPATWSEDGTAMRVHPRVRELLADELERRATPDPREVLRATAAVYEREDRIERALDLYSRAGAKEAVARLLPHVVIGIIERGDVDLAERLLAETGLGDEREPTAIVLLATLMLESARQSGKTGPALLERLGVDRVIDLVREEPRLGPFVCIAWIGAKRFDATRLLDAMPPGRAASVARLWLTLAVNDPTAPIPDLVGDALDPLVVRALWLRGKLHELRRLDDVTALAAGMPGLTRRGELRDGSGGAALADFASAIERRDIDMARRAVDAMTARIKVHPFSLFSEAELALRLERNPDRVADAVRRLQELPPWDTPLYRELTQVWEGAGLLLAGKDRSARSVLHEAIESMRRGDRILELPSALVYLAEAESRLGNTDAAVRAMREARAVAVANANLRRLILALSDFPDVLARTAVKGSADEPEWRALARLVNSALDGVGTMPSTIVHLREFGDVALVAGDEIIRPKLRKSLELLSFLLSRPGATATRSQILSALWNGRSDDAERTYLRQALTQLRAAITPFGVDVVADGSRLAVVGAVWTESNEVDALAREAARLSGMQRREPLRGICEILGRGTFLDGSEDVIWVDDQRARMRAQLIDARLDLAELAIAAEAYLDALQLAADAADADPLVERAWRLRMRALAMLGDSDGVMSSFVACTRTLSAAGLEPSQSTVRLFQMLHD